MFKAIQFLKYDSIAKNNIFLLDDNCLGSQFIYSPTGSPALNTNIAQSNAITALSIIKFYEDKSRYIPKNMGSYFNNLHKIGYFINDEYIRQVFSEIDKHLKTNYVKSYCASTINYFNERKNAKL